MKAVVCTQYGPPEVLELRDVEKPAPGNNEVLIKIFVTTCHIGDTRIRGFNVPRGGRIVARLFLGIRKPRKPVLGMDLAGEIEAVGTNVKGFRQGDKVLASTGFGFGAYAEYRCLPESGMIVTKPPNVSFEEAAPVVNGGITALCILKKADIQPGQKVLIYGASGSVGTYALQLARHLKAEVTGVCSTSNLEMIKALGADEVIDYTRDDLTRSGETYDVIFDAVGKLDKSRAKGLLKKKGTYLNVLKSSGRGSKDKGNLIYLKELLEAGELKTVIDRSYPLEQIVDAHRYVDMGHKKGNVVVTVTGA